MSNKLAVITGGNRGIGREAAKQLSEKGFNVIVTSRSISQARSAAKEIRENVKGLELNLNDRNSISNFSQRLKDNYETIDVLINNAGMMGKDHAVSFNIDEIRSVLDSNFIGAVELTGQLFPLLKRAKEGRIINVSSGMGTLESLKEGSYAAYRLSKWALNGFTILLSSEITNSNVKVNSICPGWVKTDMGGENAPRELSQGADSITWLATIEKSPNGKFFRDREEINW